MTTPILDSVERSMGDFRPRNQREFAALQIARRFKDLDRLAKYINAAKEHPKKMLIEAARLAAKRAEETGQPASAVLFDLLEQFKREEAA